MKEKKAKPNYVLLYNEQNLISYKLKNINFECHCSEREGNLTLLLPIPSNGAKYAKQLKFSFFKDH